MPSSTEHAYDWTRAPSEAKFPKSAQCKVGWKLLTFNASYMPKLVTIAVYDMLPDAQIALGRLAAEGVEAALADQHLVQTDWLYSLAVGGIKLQVAESDEARAKEILATDYSADLDDLTP